MGKTKDCHINIPRKFIKEDLDTERATFLLLYSYLSRYSTPDGRFYDSIQHMCIKLGATFDKKKNRHAPKLARDLVNCFDYMLLMQYIELKSGDFHNLYDGFEVQLNSDVFQVVQDYVFIDFAQFDYVLAQPGRNRKANMFEILYWILNCYTRLEDGSFINACCYSIRFMEEVFDIAPKEILGYLNKLCGDKTTNAPLQRYKIPTMKVKDKYRAFSCIYVKNDANSEKNSKAQYDYILKKYRNQNVKKAPENGYKDNVIEDFPDY